jgi:hypothetical protein
MGRRFIQPEEQIREHPRRRRGDVRSAAEVMVEMTQRLLDGKLEPIEVPTEVL